MSPGAVRWKDEAFVLETCPVGPWGPLAVVGMFTVKRGTGGLTIGAVGHRVESGRIGALVRDPEGAAAHKRNAPRVHQMRVGCHGESGDVRDQIRLNIDGRIGGVGGRRVRMERRFHDCSSMMQRHIDRPVQAVRS